MQQIQDGEIKSIELSILKNVAAFCEENNVEYYLVFGTLLGAVRHGGFIPWDDDIDIAMPRDAYNKFLETYRDKTYRVVDARLDPDYPYAFAKVIDTSTDLRETTNSRFPLGIYVDIFPIDVLPSCERAQQKFLKKAKLLCLMARYKLISVGSAASIKKKLFYLLAKTALVFLGIKAIIKMQNKHAVKYNGTESGLVCMPTILAGARAYEKAWLGEGTSLKFEDFTCHAPAEYRKWLERQYGDFMQLPSEEKRVSIHNFTAYKKEG